MAKMRYAEISFRHQPNKHTHTHNTPLSFIRANRMLNVQLSSICMFYTLYKHKLTWISWKTSVRTDFKRLNEATDRRHLICYTKIIKQNVLITYEWNYSHGIHHRRHTTTSFMSQTMCKLSRSCFCLMKLMQLDGFKGDQIHWDK